MLLNKAIKERAQSPSSKINLTDEQSNIMSKVDKWLEDGLEAVRSLQINATAGSGKSFTLGQILNRANEVNYRGLYLVFNKKNQLEAREKFDENIAVYTFHSFCYNHIVKKVAENVRYDEKKCNKIATTMMKPYKPYQRNVVAALVSLVKGAGILYEDFSFEVFEALLLKNDKEYKTWDNSYAPWTLVDIYNLTRRVLQESNNSWQSWIDVDDMIYIPYAFNLPMPKDTFDIACIDEAQDMNPLRIAIIERFKGSINKTVFVGDNFQSIYMFDNASPTAMEDLASAFNSDRETLTVSFRQPKSSIEFLNSKFPEITILCPDTNPDGILNHIVDDEVVDHITTESIVVARTNAELTSLAMTLLARKKKAFVLGRNISYKVLNFIKKGCSSRLTGSTSINQISEELQNYYHVESSKWTALDEQEKLQMLEDNYETFQTLAEGLVTFEELELRVNHIYQNEEYGQGITLMTGHKAKGLEAHTVYVLVDGFEKGITRALENGGNYDEARNLFFVATSRSKHDMYLVRKS